MKKPVKSPRRKTVAFDKFSALPPAIVEGKFLATKDATVYVWRVRSGQKPSWYRCTVMGVEEKYVSLWDEVASQWYCFDPTAKEVPDVRLSS